MEVKAEKKKGQEKEKKNQRSATKKKLTVVRCWLTEGQERDEKRQPILWTERPTGAVMGGWFTLASKCKLSSFVHLLLCVFGLLFTERTLFGPKILDLI